MKSFQTVLYGHFGVGNLGNDSTLEAMLHNIRRYRPSAAISCVCTGPQNIAKRFDIPTVPFDISEDRNMQASPGRALHRLQRVTRRIGDEVDFWWKRRSWFKSVDQFVVVGTGALDDMAVIHPWNAPYDLYKWCMAARLGGAKVIFLSVGAGPIENRFSRTLMLAALRTAHYRSYRDVASMDYLKRIGFETTGDSIFPDLVFSLPSRVEAQGRRAGRPHTIGVGVIGYYGWRHDQISGEPLFRTYLSKLKCFVSWLLNQGYAVRLLTGDLPTDQRPVDEIIEFVRYEARSDCTSRLSAEAIPDREKLYQEVANTDVVVATRFHNVVCALALGRPVISIGYHKKNDELLGEMGLQSYCQHIEHFTTDRLIEQFQTLALQSDQISQRIESKCAHFRHLLDVQYQKVLFPEANDQFAIAGDDLPGFERAI